MSYDPPGSVVADQFRLEPPSGSVVYFPDKPKGVSLYEGRVLIKDQATLQISNVTLDNNYLCIVSYKDRRGVTQFLRSESMRVIPTCKYYSYILYHRYLKDYILEFKNLKTIWAESERVLFFFSAIKKYLKYCSDSRKTSRFLLKFTSNYF